MKQKIVMPSQEEDATITAAARSDPDNPPLDDAFFKRARRGRPSLPADQRKKAVHIMLDQDVIAALKKDGKGISPRVNAILRKALKLAS